MRYFLCLLLLCVMNNSHASEVFVVRSGLIQGGLVKGQTLAIKLKVLGRDVIPKKNGEFVFGLGRDISKEIPIVLYLSDGSILEKTLNIEQREYATQKIEGVDKKYVSPPESVLARIRKDAQLVKKARANNSSLNDYNSMFIWPAEGPVTGVYGSQRVFNGVPKRPHFGLDVAGPVGTAVIAPAGGVVTLAHKDMYYSGGTLVIDHGYGVSSTFIHLSAIHVKQGQRVEQGARIADIGATGRVTGPHLDWRINWFDERLDPQLLVPPRD